MTVLTAREQSRRAQLAQRSATGRSAPGSPLTICAPRPWFVREKVRVIESDWELSDRVSPVRNRESDSEE